MLIKKKHIFYILLGLLFVLPKTAFADQGCCSLQGGEYYCDYSTSKLYCKDGTVSTDCTCYLAATPTPMADPTFTPFPTLTPTQSPSPTPIACPPFSSYDPGSRSCNCNSGYLAQGGNVCVSYAEYCWTKYGSNSTADANAGSCSCAQGYTWNSDKTSCISLNQFCQNNLGKESYYNGDNNTCNCYAGYVIQNNECQLIPTQVVVADTNDTITTTPVPIPTLVSEKIAIPTPDPTPIVKVLIATPTNSLDKSDTGGKNYKVVKKSHPNGLIQIFSTIVNFILHLF